MLKHSSLYHQSPRSPTPSSGEYGGGGDPTRFIEGPGGAKAPQHPNGSLWTTHQSLDPTGMDSSGQEVHQQTPPAAEGALKSLKLLSILSIVLSLNSLVFLLKVIWLEGGGGGGSGVAEPPPTPDVRLMYEVTLCLSASALSLNLCVLLLTSAQFFFGSGGSQSAPFLHSVRIIRGISTASFLFSIPLFLSAIVLFVFTHLSLAVPALVATGFIGVVIVGGGVAMVCSVWRWQSSSSDSVGVKTPPTLPSPATIELSTLV